MKVYLDRDEKFVFDFSLESDRYYDGGLEVEITDEDYHKFIEYEKNFYKMQRELGNLYRGAREVEIANSNG